MSDSLLTLDLLAPVTTPGKPPRPLEPGRRCWLWFREPGEWRSEFYVRAVHSDGMVTVEHHQHWPATVASWRVRATAPADPRRGPVPPRNAVWLIQPTRKA